MPKVSLISNSEEETIAMCQTFCQAAQSGGHCFFDRVIWVPVKPPLSKAWPRRLRSASKKVNSPTFVLMNYYKGKLPIYHFDLYRLGNPKELDTLDFDEYFYGEGSALSNGRSA